MKLPIIISAILLVVLSCEKVTEEDFDISLIPGEYPSSRTEEYHYLGMEESVASGTSWFRDSSCVLSYTRQIPPDSIDDQYEYYISEIDYIGENRYLVKMDFSDPMMPNEITIELNGKYLNQYNHDFFAYFNIIETDLYKEIECSAVINEYSGNYFHIIKGRFIAYDYEIRSKKDSIVWQCRGVRHLYD